mmetsp:Transcript_9453/g.33247  ORF Transcript_9453/g.33247 Transcript_9453/m.33247 type:complete len:217 (+) Transcript_9453:1313-1963(+)
MLTFARRRRIGGQVRAKVAKAKVKRAKVKRDLYAGALFRDPSLGHQVSGTVISEGPWDGDLGTGPFHGTSSRGCCHGHVVTGMSSRGQAGPCHSVSGTYSDGTFYKETRGHPSHKGRSQRGISIGGRVARAGVARAGVRATLYRGCRNRITRDPIGSQGSRTHGKWSKGRRIRDHGDFVAVVTGTLRTLWQARATVSQVAGTTSDLSRATWPRGPL